MNSLAPDPLALARRTVGAFNGFNGVVWPKLSLRHILAGLAAGGLVFAMHILSSLVPLREYDAARLIHTAMSDQLGTFSIIVAVIAADRANGYDSGRRSIYVLAVLVGAGLWAALEYAGLRILGAGIRWHSPGVNRDATAVALRTAYGFLEWLLIGGAATFVYLDARRARIEQSRLRRAEIERALTAKRMLESQLQAMQARVEPQFLFNTMAQVRRLYDADATLGERMLDELIAYLRAAMPQMRDTTSTVAREMELARAYLGIVKVRLGDRLQVELGMSGDSACGRMPPMMLLPLIDRAVARGFEGSGSARTLGIWSDVAAGRLRVVFADSISELSALEDEDDISGIRERLTALYGDQAQLEFVREHGASSSQTIIELPFEAIEDRGNGVGPGVALCDEHIS